MNNKNTAPAISATRPDWSREQTIKGRYEPGKYLLASIRQYQRMKQQGALGKLLAPLAVLQHRFWSAVCGADIPINATIGGGLMLPHPNGVVIHPDARIGPNCLIMQQVTIGTSGNGQQGVPTLGGHVDVGAGAKLLGNVSVGAHARIGANAVVLRDVAEGATAVGIPATVKRSASSNASTESDG